MRAIKPHFYHFKQQSWTIFLAFVLSFSVAHADTSENTATFPGTLVVTIKPLYSLLAHLTEGIVEPVLLLEQFPSAHQYSLRPSQRRLLARADMIVWTGPQMEQYLHKILQQSTATTIISAVSANDLELLNKRHLHSHNSDKERSLSHPINNIDPHIWLSSHNAIAISRHLAASLIHFDPSNRKKYKNNLNLLIAKINMNAALLQKNIQVTQRQYIAFHDAFQYLEKELALHYVDAVSANENSATSLKHIREISTLIRRDNIQCLVYQSPKPSMIDTLQTQTKINTVALDPLALNVSSNKNAWFELMQQLALSMEQCLAKNTQQ